MRQSDSQLKIQVSQGLGGLVAMLNLVHVHAISALRRFTCCKVTYLHCINQNCPVPFTIPTKLM